MGSSVKLATTACTCMYVCMCVCMHVHVCTYACMHVYAGRGVKLVAIADACSRAWMPSVMAISERMAGPMHLCVHVHVCMPVCMHACLYVCMRDGHQRADGRADAPAADHG